MLDNALERLDRGETDQVREDDPECNDVQPGIRKSLTSFSNINALPEHVEKVSD